MQFFSYIFPPNFIRIFDDFENFVLELFLYSKISIYHSKNLIFYQNSANRDIISFNEDGTAFVVIDHIKLSTEILPNSFKHQNFSSFIRQLNMYGFKKIRNVHSQNEFSHTYFRRGMEELLHKIKRRHGCEGKSKKNTAAQVQIKSNYNQIKEDISYINKELDYFFQQFGQFQNTLNTLVESSRHLCSELNMIKSKNSTCNDLLCQMFMKLAQSNTLPLNIGNNPFYKANQTTQSNRSSENNENNNISSKEETGQSNQLIETEEKAKSL